MRKKHISLDCTFRDVLMSCDPYMVAVLAATKDLSGSDKPDEVKIAFFTSQVEGYLHAITEILSYDDCVSRPDGFIVRFAALDQFSDCDWIDVGLYNWNYVKPRKDLPWDKYTDKNYETFSATFSDWKEHASREILIEPEGLKLCHTLEDLAGELMWEVTWCGFTGETTAKNGEEIIGECQAARDEFMALTTEEKMNKTISVDEVFGPENK